MLRLGLSGTSNAALGAGETAPDLNGAGISDSMWSTSTSSIEVWAANCSHDNKEPRSFPGFFGFGRKDGGLSFEEGSGERYERFERVGRKFFEGRVGVVGSDCFVSCEVLIRGNAGVGAVGETIVPNINSTSMLS